MPQICARVAPAHHAVARRIGRSLVFGVLPVLDIYPALAGEEKSMARRTRRQHAIHHIHTHAGVLLDLIGIADTHYVTRLALRKQRKDLADYLEREFARLADAEPADRVTVEVHLNQPLGTLA